MLASARLVAFVIGPTTGGRPPTVPDRLRLALLSHSGQDY